MYGRGRGGGARCEVQVLGKCRGPDELGRRGKLECGGKIGKHWGKRS